MSRQIWLLAILVISCFAGVCNAAPVLFASNGHYYEAVPRPAGINWYDANAQANSMTFNGMRGHLATVTSAEEQTFIYTSLGDTGWYWLGAYQLPASEEPAGGWTWITGEEWSYTHWATAQPDNSENVEDGLQMFPGGGWNDLSRVVPPGTPTAPEQGFIVEYEPSTPGITVQVPMSWTFAGFWTDTGLDVTAGTVLHVKASGTLRAADNPTCGPDGYPSDVVSWFDQWLNPNSLGDGSPDPAAGGIPPVTDHYYALIGYIGETALTPSLYGNCSREWRLQCISRMMLLGSDVTITVPSSGRLWLGINTDAYSGNLSNDYGYLTVTLMTGEPSLFPWNGHSYEVIAVHERLTWTQARDAAMLRGGHLATITSAEESDFVFNLAKTVNAAWYDVPAYNWSLGPWIGGYQPDGSPEPDGGWQWVTGEPWSYTNWAYNQPGNADNRENCLHLAGWNVTRASTWNDVYGDGLMWGYIVEYEPPCAVGFAKSYPDGTYVLVNDAVVTAELGTNAGGVFVEAANRSSGIKVVTDEPLARGQTLTFTGTIRRVDGEWQIDNVNIISKTSGEPLSPVGVTSRAIGNDRNENLEYTGINTTGLLVRMFGKVQAVVSSERVVYLDDGGAYQSGMGPASAPFIGIKVKVPPEIDLTNLKGKRIIVTGISRVEKVTLTDWAEVNGDWHEPGTVIYVPSVWLRDTADWQPLN